MSTLSSPCSFGLLLWHSKCSCPCYQQSHFRLFRLNSRRCDTSLKTLVIWDINNNNNNNNNNINNSSSSSNNNNNNNNNNNI